MKGFIAGLFVGAAALAIGQRLIYPGQPVSDVGQPALIVPGPATPQVALGPEPVSVAPSSKAEVTPARPPEKPRIVSANASSKPVVAVYAESRDMDRECSNWYTLKSQRKSAARQAEAKDTDWAYSTEQLLQQYAVTHRQGKKFQISSVDCRTTYCDIRASGYSEEAQKAFYLVMQEAAREPWSEFTQGTESGTESNGETITMYVVLTRR